MCSPDTLQQAYNFTTTTNKNQKLCGQFQVVFELWFLFSQTILFKIIKTCLNSMSKEKVHSNICEADKKMSQHTFCLLSIASPLEWRLESLHHNSNERWLACQESQKVYTSVSRWLTSGHEHLYTCWVSWKSLWGLWPPVSGELSTFIFKSYPMAAWCHILALVMLSEWVLTEVKSNLSWRRVNWAFSRLFGN